METTLKIRLDGMLEKRLRARAKVQHRSPSDQARRYLKIAMIAEDNPDLSFSFVEGTLAARAEVEAGLVEQLDRKANRHAESLPRGGQGPVWKDT